MPWTVKDVDRHKKGLTPSQKRRWVKIANGVLRDCQKNKGKNCEGKAIRIANSKFEHQGSIRMKESVKIPSGALYLMDTGNGANAFASGDGEKKKLDMIAYSGKVIKDHWYWGDLAIDCSGISLENSRFPILENHDRELKIAFSEKPIVNNEGIRINPDKTTFVSTDESEEFQRLSQEGFPYQSSIAARPLVVERLEEGEKTKVNGYTFKGPGSIWRKAVLKEASVVVFGYDNQTSARAFSRDPDSGEELEVEYIGTDNNEGETKQDNLGEEVNEFMDINELKEKHPDLFKQVQEEAVAEATAKFKEKEGALQTQITGLSDKLKDQDDKILKFEKNEVQRRERELKAEADRIWESKLAESDIPERLYAKVSRHVDFNKFVKDDKLDREEFEKAIDNEIQDWESRGATSSVLGQGTSERTFEGDNKEENELKEENKDLAKTLLERAGQKQEAQA